MKKVLSLFVLVFFLGGAFNLVAATDAAKKDTKKAKKSAKPAAKDAKKADAKKAA